MASDEKRAHPTDALAASSQAGTERSQVALADLSLCVEPGELLVLLGPSGCGKSTVLRLVAGLETPSEGEILIDGRIVNDVEPRKRDVAMVFQSYALYPHLDVRSNIEFPLRARRVPAHERATAVAEVAAALGLEELLDRKPGQLSGGQRQRVALARAIVRRPAAFLMDEPLSNLDAQLRVQMRAELIELHERLGTTVLYVTHDQVEAMTMGDRVAVLLGGVLQQIGPPSDVHGRPANTFVAGFVGSPPMNLLEGADAAAVIEDRVSFARAHGDPLAASVPEGVAIVGVRPEDLRISSDGALRGTVAVVEELGHERHLGCRLESGQLVMVRVPRSSLRSRPGERLSLEICGPLNFFDSDGKRVGP